MQTLTQSISKLVVPLAFAPISQFVGKQVFGAMRMKPQSGSRILCNWCFLFQIQYIFAEEKFKIRIFPLFFVGLKKGWPLTDVECVSCILIVIIFYERNVLALVLAFSWRITEFTMY